MVYRKLNFHKFISSTSSDFRKTPNDILDSSEAFSAKGVLEARSVDQQNMEARHSFLTNGLATEKSFNLEPLLKEAQKLLRKPIKDLRYNKFNVLCTLFTVHPLVVTPVWGFICTILLCNVVPYTPSVCSCLCSV